MLETGSGFLAGLLAKLAGLGAAAKVAIATTTAALTMTVAGAAAGVFPFDGGHSAPAATEAAVAEESPVTQTPPAPSGDAGVQAGGESSVTTAGGGSTSAGARATGAAQVPAATVPSIPPTPPVPGVEVPDLSGLTQIPAQVMSCLNPLVDLATSLPTAPVEQITQIGPTVVGCVSGIVRNLPLPFGLNACLSEIMGFVTEMTSQLPGIPNVGNLNVAACIPTGLPVPSGTGGLPFMGGGFPFG